MIRVFVSLQIDENTVIAPNALKDALEAWCKDKLGASFEMAPGGAWVTAPIAFFGTDPITIAGRYTNTSILLSNSKKPGPSETKDAANKT